MRREQWLKRYNHYRLPQPVRGLGHNLLIQAALAAGVRVKIVSRDPAIFWLHRGRRKVLVARMHCGLNKAETLIACRRKELTRHFLAQAGIPQPRGELWRLKETDFSPLRAKAKQIGYPLTMKIPDGSGGQLVFPLLRTWDKVRQALLMLRRWGVGEVLAEQHVPGRNYRLLALDGNLIGFSERIPPTLVGDGSATVGELLQRYNAERRGNLPLIPVTVDNLTRRMLAEQGLSLRSVPRKGQRIVLGGVVNIARGGRCREVLSMAHKGWRQVACKIGQAIPAARLLGIDLVAQNARREPREQRWWVLEVNATPEIELHHFPWAGQPSNPARAIIRALFS
jgi:cyanophycin synthetase